MQSDTDVLLGPHKKLQHECIETAKKLSHLHCRRLLLTSSLMQSQAEGYSYNYKLANAAMKQGSLTKSDNEMRLNVILHGMSYIHVSRVCAYH